MLFKNSISGKISLWLTRAGPWLGPVEAWCPGGLAAASAPWPPPSRSLLSASPSCTCPIQRHYCKQLCGSWMFIPDPNFFHPGSRIHIKEFKYFNPKDCFLSSGKYELGCSSRIRILFFYPSRIQRSKRDWIPDPDPQHWLQGDHNRTVVRSCS